MCLVCLRSRVTRDSFHKRFVLRSAYRPTGSQLILKCLLCVFFRRHSSSEEAKCNTEQHLLLTKYSLVYFVPVFCFLAIIPTSLWSVFKVEVSETSVHNFPVHTRPIVCILQLSALLFIFPFFIQRSLTCTMLTISLNFPLSFANRLQPLDIPKASDIILS